MDDTSLPQGPGVSLLDGRDQPGRAVGDDQQRGGQAPVFEIGEEAVPGIGGLARAGGQADEGGLAAGGDAPGGQHRLGRRAGVHPEEAGVQEQVVQRHLLQSAQRPGLILALDGLADRRHGGLGDRGLIPQRVGQGGLHVPYRQAAHEGRDHQRFESVRLGDVRAEQPGGERPDGAAQLRPGQLDRPGGRLHGHLPVAVPGPRAGILAGRGPLVAVPSQELGDLGLQGGLHQQLRPEPGHLLQDLWQRTVSSEQLVDVAVDTVGRRYSNRHGCRSLPSMSW